MSTPSPKLCQLITNGEKEVLITFQHLLHDYCEHYASRNLGQYVIHKITFCKRAHEVAGHEYLLAHVARVDDPSRTDVGVIMADRTIQLTTTHGFDGLFLMLAGGSHATLPSKIPAADRCHVYDPGAYDELAQHAIHTAELYPPQPIHRLIAAALVLSEAAPMYHLVYHQCYWYSAMIYRFLQPHPPPVYATKPKNPRPKNRSCFSFTSALEFGWKLARIGGHALGLTIDPAHGIGLSPGPDLKPREKPPYPYIFSDPCKSFAPDSDSDTEEYATDDEEHPRATQPPRAGRFAFFFDVMKDVDVHAEHLRLRDAFASKLADVEARLTRALRRFRDERAVYVAALVEAEHERTARHAAEERAAALHAEVDALRRKMLALASHSHALPECLHTTEAVLVPVLPAKTHPSSAAGLLFHRPVVRASSGATAIKAH